MAKKKTVRKNKYKPAQGKNKKKGEGKPLNKIFRTIMLLLVMSLLSVLCIFGYDVITQSSYFATKKMLVGGNSALTREEVLSQADLTEGMNLLGINLGTVQKKLLAHDWVARADVMRTLPSLLSIKVREHVPTAVATLGNSSFLLNEQGAIFTEYLKSDKKVGNLKLPVISGLNIKDFEEHKKHENLYLSSVITLLKMGNEAEALIPGKIIGSLHVDRDIGLTLKLTGNLCSRAGEAVTVKTLEIGYRNYRKKFERLSRVLNRLKSMDEKYRNIDSINLSDMDKVVVKAAYSLPKEV